MNWTGVGNGIWSPLDSAVVFRKTLDRHFTWLSATVVGFLILAILALLIYFVTGIEPGTALDWLVLIVTAVITVLTGASSVITLRRWWAASGRERFSEPNTEPREPRDDDGHEETTTGLSSRAEGFVETDEELYDRAKARLNGWFRILEDGEIQLDVSDDLPYDREVMLYVFAARVAFDAELRESPRVSMEEIIDEVGGSSGSVRVFISKMGERVERNYSSAEALEHMTEDQILVELNLRYSDDAAKYIKGV